MTTHAQARQEILAAWPHVFADEPTLGELQGAQSVGLEETHYGDMFNGNWGAIQGATAGADGSCPPGTFAHGDTHENGQPYAACFQLYPSPAAAAQALIRAVFIGSPGTRWDRAAVRRAAQAGDQIAFDTALRKSGYYELPLDQHIKATTRAVQEIAAALGEPIALSLNPEKKGMPWLEVGVAGLVTVAAGLGYMKWRGQSVRRNPYFIGPREAWKEAPTAVKVAVVAPVVIVGGVATALAIWPPGPSNGHGA